VAKQGPIEREFGVPFPGRIQPPERWSRTALKRLPTEGPLDWAAIFGRTAPIALDLGCGNGRFIIGSALARPEFDHLGLDILPLVIRYATRRANQRGLANIRFAVRGAFEFLSDLVARHSVRELHLYHPQPYHDLEKSHKRLVTPEFLALVHRSLEPCGIFVTQTDNAVYWNYISGIAPQFFEFHEQRGAWPDAPLGRTRREIIARGQGLKIFRGWGNPRTELDQQKLDELVVRLPLPQFQTGRC
jgi:tRNA (guanine-N7-)-methyltransferase